jgi:hypothetical protein
MDTSTNIAMMTTDALSDPIATTPAQQLDALEKQAHVLRTQHASLRTQLADAVTTQLESLENRMAAASPSSLPLPEDPAALVDELSTLHAASQYLQYLQELQALTRHAEKLSRSAERAFNDGDAANYVREFSDAVDGFSQAMGYAIAVDQIAEQGQLSTSPALLHHGSTAVARVYATGMTLRDMLSAAAQQALKKCSWPPPIMGGTLLDSTSTSGTGDGTVGGTKVEFNGFSNATDTDAVAVVQHVFIIQLTLQRAMEYKKFAALTTTAHGDGNDEDALSPVLWPAEELVQGVSAWLYHHFAQELPTDRVDKPEWLFAAALKAARQCAPYAEELQPCVDAHQLQQWYSLQLEFARALGASAVAGILRNHVLPRLTSLNDAAAWLHFVDEAIKFERALAPLRGVVISTGDGSDGEGIGLGETGIGGEDAAGIGHAASILEVIFEREEWSKSWLGAERDDAERQVDTAVEAHDAWKPAMANETAVADEFGALGFGGDLSASVSASLAAVSGNGIDVSGASNHEFYPPLCAHSILSLASALSSRQGCLFASPNRKIFTKEVIQPALKAFRSRLGAMLVRAEQFDHLLDDSGIPKVGAIICAAHFIEHNLREPSGILLMAVTADETLAAAVEKEAASMTTFRRQWAYKLAKMAVDTFQTGFIKYKRTLVTFSVPHNGDGSMALPPQGPSPSLLPAADGLQTTLRALSSHLDSVVFRDVWRAIALAVNSAFFTDVATEAEFSEQGAEQLSYDVDALIGVFAACTSRPAAHFKESKEACKLLKMKKEEAQMLLAAVHSGGGWQDAAGIKALNAEQVGSVLARRVDLLPEDDLT